MVEFVLLTPLLVTLTFATLDVGDAWSRSGASVDALQAAAVTGFDVGDVRDHDLRVMQTLLTEMDNRGVQNVQRVVFFDATSTNTPPAGCLTAAATAAAGSSVHQCVVYDKPFLDQVRAGTTAGAFLEGNCALSRDRRWCVETRTQPDGWMLGIWVEARETSLTGVIPTFRNFTIARSVVVKEWERD